MNITNEAKQYIQSLLKEQQAKRAFGSMLLKVVVVDHK